MHQDESPDIELSVVMPCLNEAATIADALDLARQFIEQSGLRGEIVVSDNGSTDGSIEIAQKAGARVVNCREKGYGFALMGGIQAAHGKYIVMGDADATYDFREAVPMVKALMEGADFVMGSRLRGNIAPGAMPSLHRWLGTPVLTRFINYFFGIRISDCNCGLRAFTRTAYQRMRLISGGMEFASEMIVKAALLKLKVVEIPCSLHVCRKDRKPHLNTWRDGWRHLRFIILFAPHVVFSLPGWILLAAGALLTFPVLFKPITLLGRVIDYHTLFFGLPLLHLGYQALWFAALETRFVRFSGLLEINDNASPRHNSIEFWLLLGSILLFAGLGCFIAILVIWAHSGFGALSEVRLGAAGLSLILFGMQTILSALLAGMLDLKLRRPAPSAK
jgi:glycosyltransferase involved in cell wall biosynthesis